MTQSRDANPISIVNPKTPNHRSNRKFYVITKRNSRLLTVDHQSRTKSSIHERRSQPIEKRITIAKTSNYIEIIWKITRLEMAVPYTILK